MKQLHIFSKVIVYGLITLSLRKMHQEDKCCCYNVSSVILTLIFQFTFLFFNIDVSVWFFFFWVQVEYMLVELDEKNEKACLVLNGNKVLNKLREKWEKANPK